jgi:hypothetical protein
VKIPALLEQYQACDGLLCGIVISCVSSVRRTIARLRGGNTDFKIRFSLLMLKAGMEGAERGRDESGESNLKFDFGYFFFEP